MNASASRPIASLRLHPDAAKVPLPDPSDRHALKESLRENGQEDPIDITPDGVILDGRTRWTLLQELDCQSVMVRVQDIPEHQQTNYIIDRAVARRHLTMAQKKALNSLMRQQVIDVREPAPETKRRGHTEPMLIGSSKGQRAAKLGVDQRTVERWDAEDGIEPTNVGSIPRPTHVLDDHGRPRALRHQRATRTDSPMTSAPIPRARRNAPAPLRKSRLTPPWSRQATAWLRYSARPEDRDFLRRLDQMVHAALKANGIPCSQEGDDGTSDIGTGE